MDRVPLSGDSVDIRNIVGATFTVEKGDIDKRERRDKSIMPVLAYLD